MKKKVFRMPTQVTINARSSSITNAFVNGIIPCIEPSEEEVKKALEVLGLSEDDVRCAYCGDKATEWDHFHPLIVDRKPTGYISEIQNLVPACGKCNQSKGNKEWEKWMNSDAVLSPKTRGVVDLEERIERLKEYEKQFVPTKYDFKTIVGEKLWKEHMDNLDEIIKMMKKAQITSDEIKRVIVEYVKNSD